MTDTIADMLIRIKNAYMARHDTVSIPHSKLKQALGDILVANNYVSSMEVHDTYPQKTIKIQLTYIDDVPAMTDVKRVSKPGRRVYASVNEIPRTLGGYGITVLSTNQGVLIDKDAKKKNVGGEVLCQVW